MNWDWEKLQEMALQEIDTTLEQMPEPLRRIAEKLPVIFERTPSLELQNDGIEADTLGVFTGADMADTGADLMPPQIILFLENVWEFAEGNGEKYGEEIRTTFLHEVGHFLGQDEEDLWQRGLG